VAAGAQLLQVFEAMGMFVSEESFAAACLPSLRRIATEMKARHRRLPAGLPCAVTCAARRPLPSPLALPAPASLAPPRCL